MNENIGMILDALGVLFALGMFTISMAILVNNRKFTNESKEIKEIIEDYRQKYGIRLYNIESEVQNLQRTQAMLKTNIELLKNAVDLQKEAKH